MRYFVKFDEGGKLVRHMEYAHLNATMQEVSEAEYARILEENGIAYTPEPAPDPEPTADELMDILLGVENDG